LSELFNRNKNKVSIVQLPEDCPTYTCNAPINECEFIQCGIPPPPPPPPPRPVSCPTGTIVAKDKVSCCYGDDVIYKLHDFTGKRLYDLPYDPQNVGFKIPCCNGLNNNIKDFVNFPFNDPKYPGWTGIKCNK
jgi:hypothetical protein